MKRTLMGLLALTSLIALQGEPLAATISDYPAGTAANGVVNSRHNLGSLGKVYRVEVGTTEVCVFCHTPHHTNSAASDYRPLWNRLNPSGPFTAYGTTIGGTSVGGPGSTTLACLSCHDGVTTFDNVVNAPGKGGVSSSGVTIPYIGWQMGSFTAVSSTMNHFSDSRCDGCHTVIAPNGFAAGGALGPQVFRLNIGQNLSDDHPVSVAYNPQLAGLRPESTRLDTINLTAGMASSATSVYNGNLNQNRWSVKGFISDTATIGDLLRGGKVECSSCHDPHFKNMSWDETEPTWASSALKWCTDSTGEGCSDGNFLRRVGGNTGSGVCRTCHNK